MDGGEEEEEEEGEISPVLKLRSLAPSGPLSKWGPTNQPTNRQTNIARYRVAKYATKKKIAKSDSKCFIASPQD